MRAARSLMPGDCLDSFSLKSLLAYAHGRSMPSKLICDKHVPKCDSDASHVTINSRSKLTGAKQGLEIIVFFRARKDFFASSGNGPLVYPEFFLISLLRGPEMRLKSLIARRKKLVSPIKARTPRTEAGIGQFCITRVLASPGRMPFSLQMSYPR